MFINIVNGPTSLLLHHIIFIQLLGSSDNQYFLEFRHASPIKFGVNFRKLQLFLPFVSENYKICGWPLQSASHMSVTCETDRWDHAQKL
jgi:hypothetical protein